MSSGRRKLALLLRLRGSKVISPQHFREFLSERDLRRRPSFLFQPRQEVFDAHMVLDRRLLNRDTDGRESIPDLTNPLVVTEGGESGGHSLVERGGGYLDGVLDTFQVRH